MTLHSNQLDALKNFCALILCGPDEKVFHRCKEHLENATDEYGGIPAVLYTLSGQDIDSDDPFGNVADADKQLVTPQYYFISSDAGAPDLADFFWFIENIQTARGLAFTVDREKFSQEDCIAEWLEELAAQLKDLYIVNFDGASEDYHFTILNKEDCERAMDFFRKMAAPIDGYAYRSFIITSALQSP